MQNFNFNLIPYAVVLVVRIVCQLFPVPPLLFPDLSLSWAQTALATSACYKFCANICWPAGQKVGQHATASPSALKHDGSFALHYIEGDGREGEGER